MQYVLAARLLQRAGKLHLGQYEVTPGRIASDMHLSQGALRRSVFDSCGSEGLVTLSDIDRPVARAT